MYQQQVEKGLILVRQEEKKHQMNCKMMTMYFPILIILKHLSLRQLSPNRRPCFVSFLLYMVTCCPTVLSSSRE